MFTDLDIDYTKSNAFYDNIVDISETVRLDEGDTVEIFAFSTTIGSTRVLDLFNYSKLG
ncbi:hypothetical protein IGI01_26015 [Bacillus thuringiensis]|nr:hypothetical protein [Bacillus thuringiensis]